MVHYFAKQCFKIFAIFRLEIKVLDLKFKICVGCTGVGMSGWHIDGTFQDCPYAYSIYHMVSPAAQGGDTMFVPLTQVIERLNQTHEGWVMILNLLICLWINL